jgi:predicted ester cyclase
MSNSTSADRLREATYTSDFISYMSFTSGLGRLHGHSGVKAAIERVRHAVEGFTETISDMIINGDQVVTRYVCTDTHTPYKGLDRGSDQMCSATG